MLSLCQMNFRPLLLLYRKSNNLKFLNRKERRERKESKKFEAAFRQIPKGLNKLKVVILLNRGEILRLRSG